MKLSAKGGIAPSWGSANIPEKVSRDMGDRSDSIAVSRDMGPLRLFFLPEIHCPKQAAEMQSFLGQMVYS